MRVRVLTKKFTAYSIGKLEKEYNMDLLDFLDIGNLSVSKMLRLIRMGNNNCSNEEAGKIFDEFMSDPEHTLLDLFIQLLDELDRDQRVLRIAGIKIDDIRNMMNNNMNMEDKPKLEVVNTEAEENRTVIKDNETPKVDVNGFVSLD